MNLIPWKQQVIQNSWEHKQKAYDILLHVLIWPTSWSKLGCHISFHVCVLDLYFKLIKVHCLISELTVRLSCYLWNVWTWFLYFKLTKVLCLISTSLIYNLPVSSVENYWDYFDNGAKPRFSTTDHWIQWDLVIVNWVLSPS